MSLTVILGAQWGDEGKGKVTHAEAEKADAVVRFNGGANAGHTLYVNGEKRVTHVLPSNIVREGALAMTGPAVVHDLEVVCDELGIANEFGAGVLLDRSAPVVLPIHKLIDGAREASAKGESLGTTKRGIGPCYEDLVSRRGVKLGDLTSEKRLRAALEDRGYYAERQMVARHYGAEPMSLDQAVEWCMRFQRAIVPCLADVRDVLARKKRNCKPVLLEGAQGILLDVIQGSRPFCTSSHCTAGGASASLGVYGFDRVIGIAKAYLTRVGAGPFPTELHDEVGEEIRTKGDEFGATTGRPRRCGWLDLVALRYAVRVGGMTELALTKLDILSGFDEIRAATGYTFEHQLLGNHETLTSRVLRESRPEYVNFQGWTEDISGVRRIDDLPRNALDYIQYVERVVRVPVTMVSVGPEEHQVARR